MGNIRDLEISKAIVSCNEMLVYFPLLFHVQGVQGYLLRVSTKWDILIEQF